MSPAAARHLPREPSWGDFHSATPTPPSEQGRGGSGSGGLGEDDLLGSFDDLLHDSPAPESASRAAHHDHPSRRSTPKDTPEHDLINLDTDAHGDVVPRRDDPHLQLYEGPSAELPPAPGPASASARGTVPASVSATASTSSTSSLHRQRSSRARGTAIPHPHPPRRMSTIDALASLAGPSSPAALSPEVGNSFIFRAHAHDESGSGYAPAHAQGYSHAQCSGPGTAEDAQTGMRRLSAQLSTSPTRSLSLSLSSMSLGHAVPPAAGSVGHFPKKRTSAEGLRGRGREGEGQGQEGRDSGQSVAGAGPASSHTRAATDPWAVFGEAEHGGRSAGAEGSELASGATSTSAPGWKQGAATLGAKATQGIKSKWKTVLGPGTFTPSRFDAFAPSSSAPGGPASLGGFSQRELDAPSATAAPIETTHHTPFARHSSSWLNYRLAPGAGAGPGSYVPPSGAPGFVPAHADADGNGWGGRVEDVKEKGEWSGTRLLGRREGTYEVLDADAADALRPFLPTRQRLSGRWTLLFSIDQHGASLSTFYRLIEKYSATAPQSGNLLIIKDAQDRRFGVYMNEWIRRTDGTYTGSGESWLFKLVGHDLDVHAKVFKWTGRNHYFALCEGGFISFGGGDGKYGLYLDAALVRGSSATCPAYDNEVLCAEEGSQVDKARFECMGLEVWGT